MSLKLWSSIPIEAFLSRESFIKLFSCDNLIIADNLIYSKRHKFNQLKISPDFTFTFPILKNNSYYSKIVCEETSDFRKKIIRVLYEHFEHKAYFQFFIKDFEKIIISHESYFEMNVKFIQLFKSIYNFKTTLLFSSTYSKEFNLLDLSTHFPDSSYLCESEYLDFTHNIGIKNTVELIPDLITPRLIAEKISIETSFIELFFEWGPYLDRIICLKSEK